MTVPLSFSQERLWFLQSLDPQDVTYNLTAVRRLRGRLDAKALTSAFGDVVARHAALRTRFPAPDGSPVAVVEPPGPIRVECLAARSEQQAHRLVAERINQAFDLAAAPPVRITLVRLADDHHILSVVLHHVIADGWSLNILFDEFAQFYAARRDGVTIDLPLPPVEFGDHAVTQRNASPDVEYWTRRLAGAASLDLPLDRARPARRGSAGAEIIFRIPPDVGSALGKFARQQRCTLFMVLLAAYQVLLARHSGQDDVLVGSPTAGRDLPELEPVVGLFASTLVLRGDLSGDPTFTEFLSRTRTRVSEAMTHRDVPIERVLSALDIERDLSRTPLFQTLFALHSAAVGYAESPQFADLASQPYPHDCRRAMSDVTLDIWPRADGLLGSLVYNVDLLTQSTMDRMAARFQRLLASVVANPGLPVSALALHTADELKQLEAWNQTECPVPAGTVADLVVEQAARTPDTIAVTCGDTTLTYRSLVAQAREVADRLRADGVKPGDIVPIQLPRSADLVAELLGVMLADAAYLPIDPSYPESRISYVLSDARSAPVPAGTAYLLYTSGSTGRPKGVVIPHSALTNFVSAMRNLIPPRAGDVWLALTSLSFDISALELYLPLISGGRVVIAGEETSRDGAALARLIKDTGVTHVQATPSGWRMLLAGQVETSDVVALAGGEALPLKLARELRAQVRRLINMYGPTETTVWSTAWDVPLEPAEVSIGYPIANTTVHVLAGNQAALIGVPGELAIGGAGLATGYHGRPELTAERFVTGPCGRIYRTGDRVRRLADGRLEFLGRLDHQVKLRGHRIEPGEVEAVLESAPNVDRAVVVVRDDALIAYVIGETEGLREHAADILPDYMLPTFVRLDAFPLTANGKINRAALPAPDRPAGRGGPPRTHAEKTVAAVFADVLGRDDVGAEDDFFALGGHSLLATKVAARLGGLPVRAVFTHSTVTGLAASLTDHIPTEVPQPRPVGTPPPLSPGQERLWFLQRLDPDDASYTMFIVRRLAGPLDVTTFRRACTDLVARHESLRTAFPEVDGRPLAVVQDPEPVDVEYIDVGSEDEARARAAQQTNSPFDLAAPPLRFTLMRLDEADHVLCVTMHHIIADGWSLNVFLDDLSTLYSGAELTELPVQHGDIALWQRGREPSLDYWLNQLADPPVLDLPRCTNGHGGFHAFRIPGDVANGLERVGREHGATLFMVLLAAYQVLLARHTGQTDLLVGSPVAGRDLVELEPVIGYLSNTVVLRGDLSANPVFTEFLERTRDTVLDAMANQDVPFESLLARLGVGRDLTRTPLLQTMAVLHTQALPRETLGDLRMTMFDAGYRQAKFDLMLEAWRDPDSIYTVLGYDTAVFDATTVAQFAERFTTILSGIASRPELSLSALPVLTEADHTLLATLGGSSAHPPSTSVPELIDEAFETCSDEIALVCGEKAITYGELGERVARTASATPGAVLGIESSRNIDTIVSLLAAWRGGAAYLPLDPDLPPARRTYLLEDSSAADASRGLAYVLYTSGSTGLPKGVLVDHENLAARVHWMREAYELGPGDRIVQLASLSFDTHAEEIYPALTTGATVVLLPEGPTALPALLARQPGITVLDLPTAFFHRLVDMIDDVPWPDSLRLIILGGEQLQQASLRRWRDHFGDRVRIVNTYGPTETTIVATAGDLGDDVHIGRPISATTVRIEDEYGRLVPPGSPGELAIGGAGVARGYRNRPDLTAQRFVNREGGRYYLTGDRVRWRPDGNLEFLGRTDDQVKVRGHRIEPGEIESRLLEHPEITAAKVIARHDKLIAYTVGRCEPGYLKETLPPYMIPVSWVELVELPLTRNGKVDTAALPDPEPVRDIGFIEPCTEAEELVVFVWGEVLGIDGISATDDFFALGGHSLLAVQVAARLGSIIEVDVPIRMLFTLPTVEQLAAGLENLLVEATS
ncbi:non-ribosomal peptide synthetase component F [Kibdelosporangium banguiense]|uniref:Non-ribosomal peptide synthetase component F n=1 Tax=Kibdelosporangium banguiense TaxID=1365924 RepID=A0ABS4TN27_9PSEU|nr:condensation domain-containing protein [Kibdelosporangium banguiense]MBP2325818.1 non-ribosomal peptide synthetase component F [Kibdelosporangium banguiense]